MFWFCHINISSQYFLQSFGACVKKEEESFEKELDTLVKPFKPMMVCFGCETAMYLIKEEWVFNDTAATLVELIDKVCMSAPLALRSKCWTLKAKYMDAVLHYIDTSETASQICHVSITSS